VNTDLFTSFYAKKIATLPILLEKARYVPKAINVDTETGLAKTAEITSQVAAWTNL
jgi:hypothetical protein